MPLQGKLWKDWSYNDKEESKMKNKGNEDSQHYTDRIIREKKRLRLQQQQTDTSEELKYFITTICTANEKELRFFLQWCQLELNKMSEGISSSVVARRDECSKVSV